MGGRQVLKGDNGSVTVEFFLVVPLVIVVLVGGLQVVSVARARIELLGAVRDGARVAATSPDPAKAVEAVQRALAPSVRDPGADLSFATSCGWRTGPSLGSAETSVGGAVP